MNTPPAYFDGMYRAADDPWDLAGRWYERRKYALTVASLPRASYRSGFEPGCSAGILSQALAARCDRLLSCDRSERAVAAARRRLAGTPHVRVEHRILPEGWPPGRFDLVVLSELLYYFAPDGVRDLLGRAVAALEPGGTLVAVHWRHPVADHAQPGDAVQEAVRALPGLAGVARHEEDDFLLDVLVRAEGPVSVAAAEGLV